MTTENKNVQSLSQHVNNFTFQVRKLCHFVANSDSEIVHILRQFSDVYMISSNWFWLGVDQKCSIALWNEKPFRNLRSNRNTHHSAMK